MFAEPYAYDPHDPISDAVEKFRAEAIAALESRLRIEDEKERTCDIECCNPQKDSAANHWGVDFGLREAIKEVSALPVAGEG